MSQAMSHAANWVSPRRGPRLPRGLGALGAALLAGGLLLGLFPAAATAVGLSWQVATTTDPGGATRTAVDAVSCANPTTCIGVGQSTIGGSAVALVETLSSGTWTPTTAGLTPAGATSAVLNGVACAAAGQCTAVGDYADSSNVPHALVETLSGGTWTATTGLDPAGLAGAAFSSVSCTDASDCVASGFGLDSSHLEHALVETLSGGTWTPSTGLDPAGATQAALTGVSCPDAADCVASGVAVTSTGLHALVETLSGGTWTPTTGIDPSGATQATLYGVSCAAAGECTATGSTRLSGVTQALIENLAGGSWTQVTDLNPPGSTQATLYGISCTSGSCTAVGSYSDPTGTHALAETGEGGGWTGATGIDPSGAEGAQLIGVSCTSDTACQAGGNTTDSGGVTHALIEYSSTSSNTPPAITSPAMAGFARGTAGSFEITSTGTPTPTISEAGALPAGLSFTDNGDGTATISGTATGAYATTTVTITATNGVSPPATQQLSITIGASPAFTSAAAATFTVGKAGKFTVKATGKPVPALSLSGSLPSGVGFTDNGNGTGIISGTPQAGDGGQYTVQLEASNVVGPTSQQSFTLTVNEVPAFTSTSPAVFPLGQSGTYDITTTSGYPGPAALTLTGTLPPGLTFQATGDGTATISGTPTGPARATTVHLTSTNGAGAMHQSLVIQVTSAPAITSANKATFMQGTAHTFTIHTTGYPLATVGESGALPDGLTFTALANGTATISGTATSPGTTQVTLTASNGISPDAGQLLTITVRAAT